MEGSDSNAINLIPKDRKYSPGSSFTLSITPPLCDELKEQNSTISEHLSSIENDRSLQEMEVMNSTENFNFLVQNLPLDSERISQEPKPPSINSSFNNSNSIISLNGLDRFINTNLEGRENVTNILDEILCNEQFKSDTESQQTSLDIFANVDLDDKVLKSYNQVKSPQFNLSDIQSDSFNFNEITKKIQGFEELIAIKDSAIEALTTELDSYRGLTSNPSSNSLGTSTTEYKQYQEECNTKLVEYHNAMVHKDEHIEKLTQALQQTILSREELKQHFRGEVGQLQEQLEKTSNLLREHRCDQSHKNIGDFEEECERIVSILDPNQRGLFDDLKVALERHVESKLEEGKIGYEMELSKFETKLADDKKSHEAELTCLKNSLLNTQTDSSEVLQLRHELDAKHSKEMEELRTYFERKCADLEKNYSEEIFSQQSRKMSGSSSSSEIELPSDFVFSHPGPGGDTKPDLTKKDVAKLRNELVQLLDVLDRFKLDHLSNEDLRQLRAEMGKFELKNLLRWNVAAVRSELQNKYHAELEILREDFDNRVDLMNVENEEKMRQTDERYREEIEDLHVQLRGRVSTTSVQEVRLVSCASLDEEWPDELLQLKFRFAQKYNDEINQLKNEHTQELTNLHKEHEKALERARRRSLRDAEDLGKGEIELLKERDVLKKQNLSLRNLLGELLKYFTQCEDELNNTLVEELLSKKDDASEDSFTNPKRVHLTPNFDDLINILDNSDQNELDSIDLKSELGSCLEKLKSDANAILALTNNFKDVKVTVPEAKESLEREVSSLTRKLIGETQSRSNLAQELNEARKLITSLESDHRAVETQLEAVLERQKVVEEDLIQAKGKIAELIENGHREIISEGYGEDGSIVNGMGDALASLEILKDKARGVVENPGNMDQNLVNLLDDLCRVAEKIVEEARKDNADLKQQVETLEHQLREMSKLKITADERCKEAESERQEAVDKIYELRDIIRDLEDQVKSRTQSENDLKIVVHDLEVLLKQQDALNRHMKEVPDVSELHQYITSLETEVQRLRLGSEIAGDEDTLQQIRNHLCYLETTIDKRTKDLEGLHSALSTNCSSPSEDMSVRDVVNPSRSVMDECEVPLQQLARLKEKLVKHSRAEDAAVKRIRDVEMQLYNLKSELEDCQTERDILKKQISDHMVLISNLQIRLDEQRIRADHIEKQANCTLEVQNYDLKKNIAALEEKISKRDKTIVQLRQLIDDTKQRLEEREHEMVSTSRAEAEIIAQMQEQLEMLRVDNLKKSKLNSEVEMLKERLLERERQLQVFGNLDATEIEAFNQLRRAGVSFRELEEAEKMRRASSQNDSLQLSPVHLPYKRNHNETVFLGVEPEFSTIEKIGPPNLFHSLQTPLYKPNSTEKHVRFEDEVAEDNRLAELKEEITKKDSVIEEYAARLNLLDELETKIGGLQTCLEQTGTRLKMATEKFQEEQNAHQEKEDQLNAELARVKNNLAGEQADLKKCQLELQSALTNLNKAQTLLAVREETVAGITREVEKLRNLQNFNAEEMTKLRKIQGVKEEEVARLRVAQDSNLELIKDKDQNIFKLMAQSDDLNKELIHSQHLLAEKDKIIAQMADDSKSLHINLETIQSKLQETGNVVDLSKRLREEQKKNSDLVEDLHGLKAQLLSVDKKSLDEITGQVQRELDYSAYLDASLLQAVDNRDFEALQTFAGKQKAINDQLAQAHEDLERKHEDLRRVNSELKNQLDNGRHQLMAIQLEDSKLIKELQIKLDSAVDNELRFEALLKKEKHARAILERRVKEAKMKIVGVHSVEKTSQEEVSRLEMQIGQLEVKNRELEDEVRMWKKGKLHAEADLKHAKDVMDLKLDQVRNLESRMEEVTLSERSMREKLARIISDCNEKTQQLESSKLLVDEMENDRRTLKKQMDQLNQKLKNRTSEEGGAPLPEKLIEKIRELRSAVKDNMKMMDLISRLTSEKANLEDKIAALEGENRANMTFDDPVSRANYLFRKYLRAESYRKALAWQKRYLTTLLGTYQKYEIVGLPESRTEYASYDPKKRSTGINRFRSATNVIIALTRMKFMVRRWHSGKRIMQQRHSQPQNQKVQFQVGQPVSSQVFASTVRTESTLEQHADLPWCGDSPPSKDTIDRSRSARTTQQPLASPGLLSKYMDRFSQIQEKLGLDASN